MFSSHRLQKILSTIWCLFLERALLGPAQSNKTKRHCSYHRMYVCVFLCIETLPCDSRQGT